MTDQLKVYVDKRIFRVHVTLPERSTVAHVMTTTDNWVDSSGNQMVDNEGNRLIFNSGIGDAYSRVVGVKKRSFRVRAEVNHG